jgi:hydrogenase-4 component E
MNTALSSDIASQLIALLAALMLVVQLLLVVQRMLLTSIRLFALQSLFLAGIAGVVAFFHGAVHVYVVVVLTLAGKVLFLPWLLDRQVRRMRIVQEIEPLVNFPTSMLVCGGLTLLGYIVARPFTSLERLGNNTLAVAITLVLTGFFLMINRLKAITQVLALLTVENGVMLARSRTVHFFRRAGGRDDPGHPCLPHPRDVRVDGYEQTQPAEGMT